MTIRFLSLALFALCFLPEAVCAAPVFLENVSESGGWYDCNKKTKWNWGSISARPSAYYSLPVDSQLCWAAAASNVLQWWQDTRSDRSSATPNGKSSTYEAMPEVSQLAIYQTIAKSWTDGGGSVEQAYHWWFNGGMLPPVFYPTESRIQDHPVSEGGYWKELNMNVAYTPEGGGVADTPLFRSYTFYNHDDKDGVYGIFKNNIDSNWGTTLSIGRYGTGHAITMWGYDTDAAGNLVVYLTDSDDYAVGMFRQKVVVDDQNGVYLTSLDGEQDVYGYSYEELGLTGCQVGEIQGFTAPLGDLRIPEPSAVVLLLCGTFLPLRRRKRRPWTDFPS